MVLFPPEIFEMILSRADRTDLLSVTLVSRQLHDIVGRILAQNVTLRGHDYKDYIKFLKTNEHFRLTKSLSVEMVPLHAIPWTHLPGLSSLSLGPIYSDRTKYPKNFVSRLASSAKNCANLQEVVVHSEHPMPGGKLSIPNLKKIVWDEGGQLSLSFFSLCQASLHTLTALTVLLNDDSSEATDTYDRLWAFRFPSLCSLEVGPGHGYAELAEVDRPFTLFLCAHPGIQRLTLTHAYESDFEELSDVHLPLHKATVGHDILPNLTFLRAHPHQIRTFVEADAGFLKTLHTLAFNDEPYNTEMWSYIMDMLSAFAQWEKRNEVSSDVRHMSMLIINGAEEYALQSYEYPENCEGLESIMSLASGLFPMLEVWEGTGRHVDDLKDWVSKFPKLEQLHFVPEYGEATLDEVRTLADRCLTLKTYTCKRSGRQFTITRDGPEGNVNVWVSCEGRTNGAVSVTQTGAYDNYSEEEEEEDCY